MSKLLLAVYIANGDDSFIEGFDEDVLYCLIQYCLIQLNNRSPERLSPSLWLGDVRFQPRLSTIRRSLDNALAAKLVLLGGFW